MNKHFEKILNDKEFEKTLSTQDKIFLDYERKRKDLDDRLEKTKNSLMRDYLDKCKRADKDYYDELQSIKDDFYLNIVDDYKVNNEEPYEDCGVHCKLSFSEPATEEEIQELLDRGE